MSPALAGCLDPTPEYSVSDRVPPVIQATGVTPSPTDLVRVALTQDVVSFTVPFRSDDAGEPLWAYFVEDIADEINSMGSGCHTCQSIDVQKVSADPRPFADQEQRSLTGTWAFSTGRPSGCHTVTLILSHLSNFTRGWQVSDPLDSAQVTWTVIFQDSDSAWPVCSDTGVASP